MTHKVVTVSDDLIYYSICSNHWMVVDILVYIWLLFSYNNPCKKNIDGLVQDCSNSIANVLGLLQPFTKL